MQLLTADSDRRITELAFAPVTHSPQFVCTHRRCCTARLIDTHTWQVIRQYAWDIGRLTAVAVSPDGALGAAGGDDGRVVVWDLDV